MDSSKNFSRAELECHCGCGLCNVNADSLKRLQKLRDLHGKPVYVISASRCEKHNKAIGGADKSEHIAGEFKGSTGFDIRIKNDRERFEIVKLALLVGFTRIGIKYDHKNIHLGDSTELDQNVMW